MSSKRNLVIGVGVILACSVVMLTALGKTKVSSVKFAQLASKKPDERCQVYGILEPASIKSIKGANVVQFDLVEEKTGQRLQVLYDNPSIALPATFPAATHARVDGSYLASDHQFVGDAVATKCPSKYNQKLDLDLARKDAMNKWQKAIGPNGEGAEKPSRADSGLIPGFSVRPASALSLTGR
jgi:cytochrome c-type biogenesis protein CcmE